MKKVAVTGSTGLVGSRMAELLRKEFEITQITQEDLDITDREKVEQKVASLRAEVFLHLAAYTNVDAAETEKEIAQKINVEGTRNLFNASQKNDIRFIYISTDFVFDGTSPPYDEDSKPNPVGYYGQTKYEGEQIVKDKAMIVRIAYPYRAEYDKRKDFMRSIRGLLEQGKTIGGITDSTFTPTFIDDIVYGLGHLINNFSPEIYHLVGGQTLSPYNAFKAIARTFGFDESFIKETTFDEFFSGKAKRPRYSEAISKKNNFWQMKSFEDGLKEIVKQYV